jgi:hypothetical protein
VDLSNVELQATTGFPIALGRLAIGDADDMITLGIAAHDRVLLSTVDAPTTLSVWPVTEIARDEYGFCRTTVADSGLAFQTLTLADIDRLSPPSNGRRRFTRSGAGAGYLRRRGLRQVQRLPIETYELSADHDSGGLRIAVSGQLTGSDGRSGMGFSIDATVPWETLHLKECPFAGAYSKFGIRGQRSAADSADRPRDPRKLGDVLIAEGLGWPYLKGQLRFTPETTWPPPAHSGHPFVSVHFAARDQFRFALADKIQFADAPHLEILGDGFVRSRGMDRFLTIAMFGREMLEQQFQRKDAMSLRLAGDALGSVRYRTGYGDEAGDPLSWIQ